LFKQQEKHVNVNNNRTGHQGTNKHLYLPSNFTDIVLTARAFIANTAACQGYRPFHASAC